MANKIAKHKVTRKAIKKVKKAVRSAVKKGVPEEVVEETVEQAILTNTNRKKPRTNTAEKTKPLAAQVRDRDAE